MDPRARLAASEVVVPCHNLEQTLAFFVDRLGFRIETIFPADAPEVAVISGPGSRLRLIRGEGPSPTIRLLYDNTPPEIDLLTPPEDIHVELASVSTPMELPALEPSFQVSRYKNAVWSEGRASMRYRDLIPGRQGGLFIASHIHIAKGGSVPDYTHFHNIEFQMIFCHKGWVSVIYEDQGDAFVMLPGDCVLQPPQIRHRVLECSPNLEVIELGCPALHETWADYELTLPTQRIDPQRLFSGQRFVRHVAQQAHWDAWLAEGFEFRDTGISKATGALASVEVIRCTSPTNQPVQLRHNERLSFYFLLRGSARLHDTETDTETCFSENDSWVTAPRRCYQLEHCSPDFEILRVTVH